MRLLLSGAAVLSLDQVGFYAGLKLLTGVPLSVLFGGWVAKMAILAFYAVMVWIYLCWLERPTGRERLAPGVADVFDLLTYRQRYEDLLARTGRDALTGALDRGQLEAEGRRCIEAAAHAGRPVSLLLIDIDDFKGFNDRFGHAAGDKVLQRIAREIMAAVRSGDRVFRFGGEEFVVIAEDLRSGPALALAERIRREIGASINGHPARITVSIGVASCAEDASSYEELFLIADRRLYEAKAAGRNCVIGRRPVAAETQVRLAYSG